MTYYAWFSTRSADRSDNEEILKNAGFSVKNADKSGNDKDIIDKISEYHLQPGQYFDQIKLWFSDEDMRVFLKVTLDSVRRLYKGLQSLRSMRRMEASMR
jgi:hypothetical protein